MEQYLQYITTQVQSISGKMEILYILMALNLIGLVLFYIYFSSTLTDEQRRVAKETILGKTDDKSKPLDLSPMKKVLYWMFPTRAATYTDLQKSQTEISEKEALVEKIRLEKELMELQKKRQELEIEDEEFKRWKRRQRESGND